MMVEVPIWPKAVTAHSSRAGAKRFISASPGLKPLTEAQRVLKQQMRFTGDDSRKTAKATV